MPEIKWKVLAKYNPSLPIVDQILTNRGLEPSSFLAVKTPYEDIKTFFPEDFFKSLAACKALITKAINLNTPIIVFGDYDADGICATSILFGYLHNELNYKNSTYFIPNRFDHGYGISKPALEKCLKSFEDNEVLIISVDTGITAVKEVEYLKSLGHEVIITDHHQKPDVLPNADVILWSDTIVGSTLAWLLTKYLGSKDKKTVSLAALATVTDLQPLLNYNRNLVNFGLKVINETPYVGLKMLMDLAGKKDSEITTYDFGFVIGPRLNASGRLQDAGDAVKLFISTDTDELKSVAQNLNSINNKRQDITLEMFELASTDTKDIPNVIVSSGPDYHEGIIGLVAARLVQRYYRPAIVISVSEDFGKGSARSIPSINIIELLRNYSDMFSNLGGHPMAAGFTIDKNRIDELTSLLNVKVGELVNEDTFVPSIDADLEIDIDLVTLKTVLSLDKIKPFGVGNKEPIFVSRNLSIVDMKLVGKDTSHLSLKLSDGSQLYKAILFNGSEHYKNLTLGQNVDIIYNAKINEFNGTTSVNINLIDIKKHEG